MDIAKRKISTIRFVSEAEIVEQIIHINERTAAFKSRRNRSILPLVSAVEIAKTLNDNANDKEIVLIEHLYTSDDNEDVKGSEVFGFQSNKRSPLVVNKNYHANSESPERASKSEKSKNDSKTPTSGHKRKGKTSDSIPKSSKKTPRSSKKSDHKEVEINSQTPETPYALRRKIASRLARMALEEETSSDEGSVYSPSESESEFSEKDDSQNDDENYDAEDNKKNIIKVSKKPVRRSLKMVREQSSEEKHTNINSFVENYFESQSKASLTSDRTLSRLGNTRIHQPELQSLLENVKFSHQSESQNLLEMHCDWFDKWMLQLNEGRNILLYGFGSKQKLIAQFCISKLQDFSRVVVNGFFPSITIKNILNTITEDILDHNGSFRSPGEQINFIKTSFEENELSDFFLLIHNIDGTMLRAKKNQDALSLLAQITGFHIIASIDHINAPLMWDQTHLSRFKWLWYDVTTFLPYTEETAYENSIMVRQSGSLVLSSINYVFHSLTPNARGIFLLLAQYQLDQKDSSNFIGMSFQNCYQHCREAFLVSSDLTLRAQLMEFRDHKLIKSKSGPDGAEYLIIPVDHVTLTEFVEQQNEAK